ncbi:MAG: FAD-dependent oxidoreductase [Candidatus Paceibacterota bacterium]
MTYDLIIIGGGPAGAAAGVYAARKKINTLLLTVDFGGQSQVSPEIHNWIGDQSISGNALAKKLAAHVRQYESDTFVIKTGTSGQVTTVSKTDTGFTVTTKSGDSFTTKTVLNVAGSNRRQLDVPGAVEFDQKGLTYCASCDGPFFTDKDVVVVGGGNAGFESAAQLLAYTKSVTLLHRGPTFKADKITTDKVLAHPNMTALKNVTPTAVEGDKFVTSLKYKKNDSGEEITLKTDGIFVEIGFIPNTKFLTGLVDTNEYGAIKIDHKTQQTNIEGIWAAGDCTDALYHQNNIAAGDAVKAIEDIYNYLHLK